LWGKARNCNNELAKRKPLQGGKPPTEKIGKAPTKREKHQKQEKQQSKKNKATSQQKQAVSIRKHVCAHSCAVC